MSTHPPVPKDANEPVTMEYTPIDKKQADTLFLAPRKESKWHGVVMTLLSGQSVFIPRMERNALESLRSIVNYRKYGVLRSRWTEMDGAEGRLIKLQRHGGHR